MSSRIVFTIIVAIAAITSATPTGETASSTVEPAIPVNNVSASAEFVADNNSSSVLANGSGDPLSNHSMGDEVSSSAVRASGNSLKRTDVKEILVQCYSCNSFEDGSKCSKKDSLQITTCHPNQHACHYITGTLVQNGITEKNVVFAGCDVAPAVKLPMMAEPIMHTAFNNFGCHEFAFFHKDAGAAGAVKADNIELSFEGKSCNCDPLGASGPGCNKAYANASPKNFSLSIGLLFASLTVVIFGKVF